MNPPVARVGDAVHLLRRPFSLLFGKLLFEFLHTFIVPLVPRFYRTTVNQSRHKAPGYGNGTRSLDKRPAPLDERDQLHKTLISFTLIRYTCREYPVREESLREKDCDE
jgi:hypothetical protein